jgi:hypothetical protein
MSIVFSYPSLFLAKQEFLLLIICLLLVVTDRCIPSLVDYEFLDMKGSYVPCAKQKVIRPHHIRFGVGCIYAGT